MVSKKPIPIVVSNLKSQSFHYNKDSPEFLQIIKEGQKPVKEVEEDQDIELNLNFEHKYLSISKYQADHGKVENLRSLK